MADGGGQDASEAVELEARSLVGTSIRINNSTRRCIVLGWLLGTLQAGQQAPLAKAYHDSDGPPGRLCLSTVTLLLVGS